MSEKVYLQWNFPNWVTVFVMVVVGYTAVTAAVAFIAERRGAA